MSETSHVKKHSSSSYLELRYRQCCHTYRNAESRICQMAVDIYMSEVDMEFRTIKFAVAFDDSEYADCLQKNVKKARDFMDPLRSVHQRFEFGSCLARAMDELFGTDVCEQLQRIMFPAVKPVITRIDIRSSMAGLLSAHSNTSKTFFDCCMTGNADRHLVELHKALTEEYTITEAAMIEVASLLTEVKR